MWQGNFYRIVRVGSRIVHAGWRSEVPVPEEACVYVCSHHNMHGPILTLTLLDFPVHAWVLHVFFDRESCRKQYAEYTFSKRFGMPQPVANALAWLVSGVISGLVRSTGAIAVWRGTSKIHATFRESLEALKKGESVLIFPDVEYSAENEGIGAMYDGFLLLGRMYTRAEGKGLPFVPLYCDEKSKRVVQGEPVVFRADAPYREESERVKNELAQRINEMAQK
ncbi:MAG: hypothetical protein SO063_03185 [Eubacteriales bacterium]|nr:hypothetical protein [Eubacteriales bacterium]